MAIRAAFGRIVIAHPVFCKGMQMAEIGAMSTELGIWLNARYQIESMPDNEFNTDIKASMGKRFERQENIDWDMRSRLAATRGYASPLCLPSGDLTALGTEKAKQVFELYAHVADQLNEDDTWTSSDKWTKADHVIMSGDITVRQAAMLRVVRNACLDAERTNRTRLDARFIPADLIPTGVTRRDLLISEGFNPDDYVHNYPESPKAMTTLFEIANSNNDSLPDMQGFIIDDTTENVARLAWVPTATFGQKARNDLKNLIRYGLVDLRAWHTPTRGRSKHIIRVSLPGQVLLSDLEDRKLIGAS